ncbi:MAG: hypothetical protein RMI44_06210, partial [Aquificaceae bacterium]|nr:hypothetical protein [Aquificaceae bacterium]
LGLDPVVANITNTVALWVGSLRSSGFKEKGGCLASDKDALRDFLGFTINLLGALLFALSGKVSWLYALVMMPGFVLRGYAGAGNQDCSSTSTMWVKSMPALWQAMGKRLSSVMPGRVFTSSR